MAAIKIQAYARRMVSRIKFINLIEARRRAATRLQKAWRRTRNKNDFVNVIKAFRIMHATTIQRYMRGYLVTQKLVLRMRKEKLMQTQNHFDKMKEDLEIEAVIKLQQFFRATIARR